ncbi:glycerophosphodiester phosphodiesterase (plasmid) [Mesorhizobium sp. AR10]|uniref:glycerophosphodiester phosphodiesterase n=1 Tax=Mesorhizobium sp. AR10 TaxID=2865839 RepID=UPI0021608B36|nr:glycerophosphodiester phosphodiesterase [Mesorhizobium sp. AR10]UVK35511.1 glycerophosphodiester phosphodiesterase [Mesorhizobium sp. AR10]
MIIAHGGASSHEPSNTMSAFRAAGDRADVIEMDVRLTDDGEIVCYHDDVVNDGGSLRELQHMSWEELVDAAPTTPKFSEVARLGHAMFLDVKETDPERVVCLVEKSLVFADPRRLLIGIRSCVESDDLYDRFPAIRQVALMREDDDIMSFARLRPNQWARLHQPRASAERILHLRAAGLRIVVTSGIGDKATGEIDPDQFRELIKRTPDAVIVNDPSAAWHELQP